MFQRDFDKHNCQQNTTAQVVRYDMREKADFVYEHFTEDTNKLDLVKYCVEEKISLASYFPILSPPLNVRGLDDYNLYGAASFGTKILIEVIFFLSKL